MSRWIAGYISPQGVETPWIEQITVIKKGLLTLEAKIQWWMIRYYLLPTTLDNKLTYKGATLVAYLIDGYDIDFAAILKYTLHDRAFGKTTNLPFPYMIQMLCDKEGVPELPGIDKRVTMTTTV